MGKYGKIIIGIVLVALVIAGIWYVKNGEVKETENKNLVNSKEVKDAINTIKKEAQNTINTIDNDLDEEIDEDEDDDEDILDDMDADTELPVTTSTNELSNNEKAINMVKKEWGTDNNVTFKIDEQNENGKYVIGVVDKNTTKVITWYEVDIKNNTIKEKF